jgi:hypothetical protein
LTAGEIAPLLDQPGIEFIGEIAGHSIYQRRSM